MVDGLGRLPHPFDDVLLGVRGRDAERLPLDGLERGSARDVERDADALDDAPHVLLGREEVRRDARLRVGHRGT